MSLPAAWTLHIGNLIVTHQGRAPVEALRKSVSDAGADGVMIERRTGGSGHGGSRGSEASRVVKHAVGQLRRAGLARRDDDVVIADDVAALEHWLAEQRKARLEAGMSPS